MLSKKFLTFVSAVLAMGLLVGCNSGQGGGSSQAQPSGSTSTSTSASASESGSDSGSESASDSSSESQQESTSSSTVAVTHTVTFYDGGKVYGDPVTVNDGATVAKPAVDPTKEGDEFVNYVFENWYESGATTAYDFATPVTGDLDLYSKYTEVAKEYDLVVYVYGVNGASSPTTYITETESNRILQEFKGLSDVPAETKILWYYSAGLTNTKFNKSVNDSKIPVDLVISGAKLNNDDDVIECDATYGKVKVGEGWFANTTRYLAVTAACVAGHKDMAVKLYNMVKAVGPDYAITLSNSSLTLEVGASETVTATYYGAAPTWALQNVDPAGCVTLEGNTVTAVAAGTAKLVATDAANHTAECVITVSAAPVVPEHDLVVVFNISNANNSWMREEDAQTLVNRFTSAGQPGEGKDVELHVVAGVDIAGVVSQIATIKSNNELAKVDAALCREAFFTNASCPDLLDGYTPVAVDSTWKYNVGQYGIFNDSFEEHRELARAFGDFVSAQNVDYFEFSAPPLYLDIGGTYQITTELTGLTYSSSAPAVATVSESGLIEGVGEGSAKIKVSKNAYYVEISVSVLSASFAAVTLNIYVCVSNSSDTYMPDDEYDALTTYIDSLVPSKIKIEWHKVTKKSNSGFVTYIKGLETDVDLVIAGSGAIGSGNSKINTHADMPSTRLSATYCSGGQRNFAGYASMPAAHVAAAQMVYSAFPVYSA